MGIHGIYKEIGPGTRIALSKLAAEHLQSTGRPLRIAIDISIWLFQIQSSKGMFSSLPLHLATTDKLHRWNKPSSTDILLSPPPPDIPLHPPSFRIRWPKQTTLQAKQTHRSQCRLHPGVSGQTIAQAVRDPLPSRPRRSRSRMRTPAMRRHRRCRTQRGRRYPHVWQRHDLPELDPGKGQRQGADAY